MKHFNPRICAALLLCLLGLNAVVVRAEGSAGLFFSTPSRQTEEGEVFSVDVKVQSSLESINAISGGVTFPEAIVRVVSTSKDKSIINLWTQEPKIQTNKILFEGLILNPGWKGASGSVFKITFEAKRAGTVSLGFSEGAILANDGAGTNILGSLKGLSITIGKNINPFEAGPSSAESPTVSKSSQTTPPVITSVSPPANYSESFSVMGKGTPKATTKIEFQDVTEPSIGIRIVRSLVTNRVGLSDVEVKNDDKGIFSYISPKNLVAGTYNVVPSYVGDDKTENAIGYGIKLFVKDNILNEVLIIIINALVLVIPIVALVLIILFLPWYFKKRLRIMNRQMELEEEKIGAEGNSLMQNPQTNTDTSR
jgi:hypothetical protein